MGRTARVCNKQGCAELTFGTTYCEQHKLKAWANSTRNTKNPPGWQRLRMAVMHRDSNTCTYCGNPATEVDHIIPVTQGGTHRMNNLTAACTPCNRAKNIKERRNVTPPQEA
jgi:5-methylcytosine-specific restriction endonuclease McrA